MSLDIVFWTRGLASLALAALLSLSANVAVPAQGPPPAADSTAMPLVGTYWRALAGKATPVRDAIRDAHLQFQTDGRVSGSDSCNRTMGSYTLNGESLTFGRMGGTQMACGDTGETERTFREALQETSRWRIVGDRLELFNGSGTRLAVFAGQPRTPADLFAD